VLAVDGPPPVAADAPVFCGTLRPAALVRVDGAGDWREEPLADLAGREVVAVAGVARPARLADTLVRAGARVQALLTFPDHHPYGDADAARIAAVAAGRFVITTEKDLVKLAPLGGLPSLRAVRVNLEVEDGDRLVDLLTRP
jgi:tetraacyldisaccharide 4'-kinase